MVLNHKTTLKISEQMKKDLKEISIGLGFREGDVTRSLLNNAIQKIKAEVMAQGGYDGLTVQFVKLKT